MPDQSDILGQLRALADANELAGDTSTAPRFPDMTGQRGSAMPGTTASFSDINKRPGIPLDVTKGPPAVDMLWASFRKDPEQVVKYWQDKYGAQNVRLASTGDPIVKVLNEQTGKPEEILTNPVNMTAKDLVKVAGTAPEIAMAILFDKGAGMIPVLKEATGLAKVARQAGAQAVGAETGGVLKDVAVRSADLMPITSAVVAEHAKEIPKDLVANLAMAGAGKALSKVISPYGGELAPVQEDLKLARPYLKQRFGVNTPYSVGETTGGPIFQRTEEEMKRLPGGFGWFNDIRVTQQEDFSKIQRILTGADLPTTATTEQVGKEAIEALRTPVSESEAGLTGARVAAVKEANKGILQDISAVTTPQRQLYTDDVGKAIRKRVESELEKFRAESAGNYEAAYSLEGGRDRILAPPSLASEAKKAIKELPPQSKIIEKVDYDQYGSSFLRTTTGEEVSKEFVPEKVVGKLRELAASGPTKFSLRDLVSMRNDVTNDIKAFEAVPGVQTHHLNKIRDMLTTAIKESTEALPTGDLKTAWEKANKHYADNVGKFHTHAISTILKTPEVPGSVGNSEIVSRLISEGKGGRATDTFMEMRDFLGANSAEFKALKRSIADSLYENSFDAGRETLKAKDFIASLENMRTNQRRVFDEVFGSRGGDIIEKARGLALADSDKLDAAEMEKILANPKASVKLKDLVDAQRERDEFYKNSILRSVGSNALPKEGINPGEFISRFAASSSPKEVKQAMEVIQAHSPELAEQVRFKAIENLLQESGRSINPKDRVAMMLDPQRVISSYKLQNLLQDKTRSLVLREIIGDSGMEDLKMLARATRPIEAKETAFASAAGMSAGAQINRFWQGGVFGFIDKAFRKTVVAGALTFPLTRAYFANMTMNPERTAKLITMAVSSRPVVQELINDYGAKGAIVAAQKIKDGIEQYRQANQSTPSQEVTVPDTKSVLDMLRNTK